MIKLFDAASLLENSGLFRAWTLDLCRWVLLDLVDWLATELSNRHLLTTNIVVLHPVSVTLASLRRRRVKPDIAGRLMDTVASFDTEWVLLKRDRHWASKALILGRSVLACRLIKTRWIGTLLQ